MTEQTVQERENKRKRGRDIYCERGRKREGEKERWYDKKLRRKRKVLLKKKRKRE